MKVTRKEGEPTQIEVVMSETEAKAVLHVLGTMPLAAQIFTKQFKTELEHALTKREPKGKQL